MALEGMYTFSESLPHEGGQGTVFSAIDNQSQNYVAIKRILVPNGEFSKNLLREMSLLAELKHPSIVRMHKVLYEDPFLYIVTEELPYNLVEHKGLFADKYPKKIRPFMRSLLEGIDWLHKHLVVHRDIKPQNLLVTDGHASLKLCDFGHARAMMNPELTPGLVTINYRAPELLLGGENYSYGVDIWAIGCVFAEMSTWKEVPNVPPFLLDSTSDNDSGEDIAKKEAEDIAKEESEKVEEFFEEVPYKPMFGGDTENPHEVLSDIFRLVGTPTEDTWPGVTSYPLWVDFDKSDGEDLGAHFSVLGPDGVDLLSKMLCLDPRQRITAADALLHPYFKVQDQ